jgi:hypothetical protein
VLISSIRVLAIADAPLNVCPTLFLRPRFVFHREKKLRSSISSMIKCFFGLSAYLAGDQVVNQAIHNLDII